MRTRFVLGETFSSLDRNVTITVIIITMTAVSLALLAAGILVTEQTSCTRNLYLNRVKAQVELNKQISTGDQTCSSPKRAEVVAKLEEVDGIRSVTFRNRQQNSNHFAEMSKDSDSVLVGNAMSESLPTFVMVCLSDPTDVSPPGSTRELPQVGHVIDQHEEVSTAAQNLNPVRDAIFLLVAVRAVAAAFLIANMVQIVAFSRRKEVEIMQMVDASRWSTQMPFVPEAVIVSLIGGVLVIGAPLLGKATIIDPVLSNLYKA